MAPHHDHPHAPASAPTQLLVIALAATATYALVEAVVGWWAGSLALLADAGHMVSDSIALGLAAGASVLAQRPASERHSYGLGRAEVIAAVVNAALLLAIVAGIAWAAVERLQDPGPVAGGAVLGVAAAGLALNLGLAWLLSRGEQTLNVRAALLNVAGDALGSVAAIVSGAVILATGWTPIDPILSLFICALLVVACIRLLKDAVSVVMEAVPRGIDLAAVGATLANVDGVRGVHDLHIWQVASGNVILTAHLVIGSMDDWNAVHAATRRALLERYGIDHVTLQPETVHQP